MFSTLSATPGVASAGRDLEPLAKFRWDYRLVLYLTDTAARTTEKEIASLVKQEQEGIAERDMRFVRLDGTSDLPLHLKLTPSDRETILKHPTWNASKGSVWLVGKDGGVKAIQEKLRLHELFRLIDQMPMRRAEMKED